MKALFMISPYIEELLNGNKTFDTRSYDTWTRGTIDLVQSKSNFGNLDNWIDTSIEATINGLKNK